MARKFVCGECGGKMQPGYVAETAGALGIPYDASYWVEGKPERTKWRRLITEDKTKYYVSAYRCERCGLLKFYAGPDNSKTNK